MKSEVDGIPEERLADTLAYVGLVLLAYELIKSLVVNPIKFFYKDVDFSGSSPWTSYDEDVRSRHKNEFEAALLYLRDFMQAIDSDDLDVIQALRKQRNDLAHNLSDRIASLDLAQHAQTLKNAEDVLFKLSNYNMYMEIGVDPEFGHIDWSSASGPEFTLYSSVVQKLGALRRRIDAYAL